MRWFHQNLRFPRSIRSDERPLRGIICDSSMVPDQNNAQIEGDLNWWNFKKWWEREFYHHINHEDHKFQAQIRAVWVAVQCGSVSIEPWFTIRMLSVKSLRLLDKIKIFPKWVDWNLPSKSKRGDDMWWLYSDLNLSNVISIFWTAE